MNRFFSVLPLVAVSVVAGAALVGGPVACETPIASAYILNQPRILAIRATGPELLPSGTVGLDALVYTPAGSAAPTYNWSWCASLDATLGCATTAAALTSLLDPDGSAGVAIDYSLGTDSSASFSAPVSLAVIEAACRRRPTAADAGSDGGDAGDTSDAAASDAGATITTTTTLADGGAGLTCTADSVTIDILLTVTVGGTTLQAVRQLTVDFDTTLPVNTNPTIDGLAPFDPAATLLDAGALADARAESDGGLADAAIGSGAGGSIGLAADVPLTATDLYPAGRASPDDADESVCVPVDLPDAALDGSTIESTSDGGSCVVTTGATHEALSLAWYVESGQLASETTSMPAVKLGAAQDWSAALLNTWTPAGSGAVQMIVVARDDRGGVGWIRKTVSPAAAATDGSAQ